MTAVSVTLGGRRVIVSRPDGSEPGRLGVDILTALARARANRAAACFLRPRVLANEPLFSLATDEVPVLQPHGIARVWVQSRWQMRQLAERGRRRAADARALFWLEWYRELRRHVADERLPLDLRGRLRRAAQRSFARWAAADRGRPGWQFARVQLRDRIPMRLPESLLERARTEASQRGIPPGPLVAIDVRGHVDDFDPILDSLAARGYAPVRLGDAPLVDVFVLLTSVFLLCDNADAQRTAYATNTPTLTINATDAFAFYPVRRDGIYLLKEPVDLDSGRTLSPEEMLDDGYYRNLRNYGYRENRAADVRAAVDEMLDGVRDGWHDTTSQARYRTRVVEAGVALAPRVRHIAKWGPVDGFIGDGRLASVQAERRV